jgi:hypothetical protein
MTAVELRERVGRTRRGAVHSIRAFYSRSIGWLALFVTSAFLAYGGGGVMFWFHAVFRGEDGPPIDDLWHWLFDSTLGFLALTPALFFILPLALRALSWARVKSGRVRAAAYVVLVGVMFGVVTGPGPLLHNALVGRDTWLAQLAVDLFGYDAQVAARNAAASPPSELSSVLLQIVVGTPVYVAAGLLALATVRTLARVRAAE